jgi:hypothetical protein
MSCLSLLGATSSPTTFLLQLGAGQTNKGQKIAFHIFVPYFFVRVKSLVNRIGDLT